ncbi:unnamed protein product [Callosobruchus maculatus]|uniref:Uncharacterized protein n=1 Tax=Callosobruchus maculatus TaxID=64391 RepID=A0A653CIK1_CALMS|nr:unnamed protein product [Callosobruchus maculatus]
MFIIFEMKCFCCTAFRYDSIKSKSLKIEKNHKRIFGVGLTVLCLALKDTGNLIGKVIDQGVCHMITAKIRSRCRGRIIILNHLLLCILQKIFYIEERKLNLGIILVFTLLYSNHSAILSEVGNTYTKVALYVDLSVTIQNKFDICKNNTIKQNLSPILF